MQRKIFIAINPDKATRQYINKKIVPLENSIKGKWVPYNNYHITLLYVGFVDDQEMVNYCRKLKKGISGIKPFELEFNSIGWGPNEQRKKMIWIKGKENNNLIKLREIVEEVIKETKQQHKKFNPHITCARINRKESLKTDEDIFRKEVTNVAFSIFVQSIDVMESLYERGRSIYKPLDIIEFK